jgi:Ca2+-binding RTX toxin-like protein
MTATFNRSDLEYLLTQIEQAEGGQPPVNAHLAFGLREVAGTNNNQVPGQSTFGAADQAFGTATTQYFQTVTVNIDGTIFDPNPGTAGDTMTTSYAQTSPNNLVVDTAPRTISNLISDISTNNPAAVITAQEFAAQLGDGYTALSTTPTLDPLNQAYADGQNLFIGNITPDAGLSAPFNGWTTFFGQFFDHGLDLITKGNAGTVFIPLAADDPLRLVGPDGIAATGDEVPASQAFMVLTRATNETVTAGADNVLGTADDVHTNINTTTPFVDQNQTYSSHPSHQVFLREYVVGVDGDLHATGKLLQHAEGKDNVLGTADDNSGMATWHDLKANALKLGIVLTDYNVNDVPLLATDAYGNFIAGPNGHVQVVVALGGGGQGLIEMNPASPQTLPANTIFTGHAFINDMAHFAAPFNSSGVALAADGDSSVGNPQGPTTYDNELLDAHYVAGDGRVNENIALTAVHEIFHDEHNRLIDQIKGLIQAELNNGDTAFASSWVLPGVTLTAGVQITDAQWNGERLFQVAKFGTETQYQHLVFEEFARKIAPTIHLFGNVDIHLDPAITSEFANAVYRFGHSMLDENVARFELNADGTPVIGPDGQPVLSSIGLIEAFTNPLAFAERGADAAAEIVQGSTHQIGSEIDEFVTGALRNNLLGLPLDLAALNIARGRDTGVAPLNLVRAQIYDATHDQTLKPYASWTEFGQFLKHPASLINFVAAYGTHASIVAAVGLDDKRTAAMNLVTMGLDPASQTGDAAHQDAYNFMHSLGAYANDVSNPLAVHAQWSTGSITGIDNVDLWIGGLAEKQNLFGGLLGSTFNFIFETQLESLQDGDRLYYLPRIEGMHWGAEIENNSFAEMITANTGAKHLPASIFLTPEYTVEASTVTFDPLTWLKNPVTGAYLVEKLADGTVHFIGDDNFFGNTMVLGGTEGDDRLQAGHADDDTVWGDGGNDWIDGGNGNDFLYGGTGNDTIVDSGGDDVIHGDAGNDTINGGIGDDIIFGNDGDDYIETGYSILGDEAQGGLGNDIIVGGDGDDALIGNEGDDWLEGGAGGDGLVGDTGAPTGQVPLFAANDVLDGGANGDKMVGFSGDDIMLGEGGFDKFNGLLGFDWADFEKETHGVSVDMERREFIPNQQQTAGDAVRDFFVETEATSGSRFDDFLQGTEDAGGAAGVFNELTNVDLIFNLKTFFAGGQAYNWDASGTPIVGGVGFSTGNIVLGGDGSDTITGRGGNDIIDGDAWLHVELSSHTAGAEIIREIRFDYTDGDIDTAVYRDVIENYTINLTPDAEGFITIAHNVVGGGAAGVGNDGIDRLRNIERLQFADTVINVDASPNANQVPVGVPLILGDTDPAVVGVDPVVGSPLTADVGGVTDADGIAPGSVHFQWQQQVIAAGGQNAWINITGATNATFTPTNLQLGNPLRVVETYTDGKGLVETVASAPTNVLAPNLTVNTAPFVVPQQGAIGLPDTNAHTGFAISIFLPLALSFGDNETAPNLLTFTARIAGTNQALDGSAAAHGLTFTLVPDLVNGGFSGATITGTVNAIGQIPITITAKDEGNPNIPDPEPSQLSVTDTFVINVQAGNLAPVLAPGAENHVATEDTVFNGNLLAGSDSDGPAPTPVFRLVDGSAVHGTVSITGATGAFVFTPEGDFAGQASFQYRLFDGLSFSAPKTVTLDVHAVDDGVADVAITGTAAAGDTISAVIGSDPDGFWISGSDTYQWFRDGVAIVGATGIDLALTHADIGHKFSVQASYTDGQGFTYTAISAPLAAPVSSETDPVGIVGVTGIPGGGLPPRIAAFNTLSDPDNGVVLGTEIYAWEVSTNGVNWSPADPARVSADTLTFTPAVTTGAFVRVTLFYIDGLGNLNSAVSDATRYVVDTTQTHTLTGTAAGELIFGNGGNDTITAGAGNDFAQGGAGNDTFFASIGDGDDTYDGGNGTDTYTMVNTTAASNVDLTLGIATSTQTGNDKLFSIEDVTGSAGNNVIVGSAAANTLRGNGGDDTLDGGSNGNDTLFGGLGNDTYIVSHNGMTLTENANQGTDSVFANRTFTLANNLENLTLTGSGNFNGTGNGAANVIQGNSGNNTLSGQGGDDRFVATIGDGNDSYSGGGGTDTLDLSGITAATTVNLQTGVATGAQIGNDSLNSIEVVIGGSGNDTITANSAPERFTGGAGADTFVYGTSASAGNAATRSVIIDFQHGIDHINFAGIDADTRGASPGVQHFTFDGQLATGVNPAQGHIGFHYVTIAGQDHTIIDGNIRTGNAIETNVDFQVDLLGHIALTGTDFFLT